MPSICFPSLTIGPFLNVCPSLIHISLSRNALAWLSSILLLFLFPLLSQLFTSLSLPNLHDFPPTPLLSSVCLLEICNMSLQRLRLNISDLNSFFAFSPLSTPPGLTFLFYLISFRCRKARLLLLPPELLLTFWSTTLIQSITRAYRFYLCEV